MLSVFTATLNQMLVLFLFMAIGFFFNKKTAAGGRRNGAFQTGNQPVCALSGIFGLLRILHRGKLSPKIGLYKGKSGAEAMLPAFCQEII